LAQELGVNLEIGVGLTDAQLGSLYESAHATLYLAKREPLGLASLEAQACGCPVIVAAEGGLPETIVDGTTGWQVARDPGAAVALVDRLSDDRLRARMSAAAREHAKAFTWRASAERVENLLREISGQASR
jgi:glycosyltransferase involved in cell wall biosynthesis